MLDFTWLIKVTNCVSLTRDSAQIFLKNFVRNPGKNKAKKPQVHFFCFFVYWINRNKSTKERTMNNNFKKNCHFWYLFSLKRICLWINISLSNHKIADPITSFFPSICHISVFFLLSTTIFFSLSFKIISLFAEYQGVSNWWTQKGYSWGGWIVQNFHQFLC